MPRNYEEREKLQRKRSQPLRIAKLIELSGWAKPKEICKSTYLTCNTGVILDKTLNMLKMSFHIKNIVKGAFYHLRNIAKIRKYINVTTAEVLAHAFVNSKQDFCNSLLHGLP